MRDFGLAGEGVTDQIVLENILFGLYQDYEGFDDDEIAYLQPLLDATDEDGLGSWTRLLTYLDNKRFRADVLNHSFIVVQVDTDVAAEKGFDVILVDENNRLLPVESIVKNVSERLIAQVDMAQEGFYEEHKDKIIFAVSVDSLECWLYCLYKKSNQSGRTQNCVNHLERLLASDKKGPRLVKDKQHYDKLSELFYKRKGRKIDVVAENDVSFGIFIQALRSLPYPDN